MNITAKDVVATISRVLIGFLFLLSGFSKLSAPEGTIGYIASSGLPFPQLGYAIALLVELGLTALFILGYKTRFVATILGLFTIVTALLIKSEREQYSVFDMHPLN